MTSVKDLKAYKFLREKDVKELNSTAYFLEHKKSGARLFLLSNDDENKVFSIGFRTPPSDSTGVPHILEHCVLCGSERFPVKDPFVELVSGVLSDNPLFVILNSYTTGLAPSVVTYILETLVSKTFGGHTVSDELGLPVTQTGLALPCGATGRWTIK